MRFLGKESYSLGVQEVKYTEVMVISYENLAENYSAMGVNMKLYKTWGRRHQTAVFMHVHDVV